MSVESGAESSSFNLGKNDCNSSAGAGEDSRYDCRKVYRNFFHECEDESDVTAPFRCGSWDCYCCGYRMRMNLIEEIQRVVTERPELRRLLTLTLDPKKIPEDEEPHRYLTETWRKMRVYIRRKYGDFSFIWVREEQDNGNPHLHILVSKYLPQEWVSRSWSSLGGGEVVDIRRIDRVEKAGNYLGKYLTKNSQSDFPDNTPRYNSSDDINLDVRGGGDSDKNWILKKDDRILGTDRPVYGLDFYLQKKWNGPKPPPELD